MDRRVEDNILSLMRTNDSTALIVIDAQNGFVNEHSEHVLDPICDLLDRWTGHDAGKLTIFTRFHNDIGSNWDTLIHWRRLRTSPETDLHPRITPYAKPPALIEDKRSYTCLTPNIKDILAQNTIDTVLLAGIATDSCVLMTAVDIFQAGLKPMVLADCCASHAGPEIHQMGLTLISRNVGSDQLIESGDLELE